MDIEITRKEKICVVDDLIVDGIHFDIHDLGTQTDICPEKASRGGCGKSVFIFKAHPKKKVLDKYGISEQEYGRICRTISKQLYIGKCDNCC